MKAVWTMVVLLLTGVSLQAEDVRPGTRVVVIRDKAELRLNGATKGQIAECSAFTVDKIDGQGLWIGSQQGYLKRSDVIPFSEAVDYYTREITRTKSADAYWHRAQVWRLKGELKSALADLNDAIRIRSNDASLYRIEPFSGAIRETASWQWTTPPKRFD